METHDETLIWLGVLWRVVCWTVEPHDFEAFVHNGNVEDRGALIPVSTVRCLTDGLDGGRDLKGGQHNSTVQLVLQGFC